MDRIENQSLMYSEAKDAANCVARQLGENDAAMKSIVEAVSKTNPDLIMTCARGSSDHAASYAKYLFETRMNLPTVSVAPSINSVYGVVPKLPATVFIAISQSGQSPDLLAATRAAHAAGAGCIAFVNDTNSPLAQLCDWVVPLHAGTETSVAATKSFICTLSALIHFVAEWTNNSALMEKLRALPAKLEQSFALDWSGALPLLVERSNLFVVGRGLGFGIAQEAALKFKEVCGLHAEAFSAAEVKHGPMSLAGKDFPVWVFSTLGKAQASIDTVAEMFLQRGACMISVGGQYSGAHELAAIYDDSPEFLPILHIQAFYKYVEALSRARGLNPDRPPYLNKVTETL